MGPRGQKMNRNKRHKFNKNQRNCYKENSNSSESFPSEISAGAIGSSRILDSENNSGEYLMVFCESCLMESVITTDTKYFEQIVSETDGKFEYLNDEMSESFSLDNAHSSESTVTCAKSNYIADTDGKCGSLESLNYIAETDGKCGSLKSPNSFAETDGKFGSLESSNYISDTDGKCGSLESPNSIAETDGKYRSLESNYIAETDGKFESLNYKMSESLLDNAHSSKSTVICAKSSNHIIKRPLTFSLDERVDIIHPSGTNKNYKINCAKVNTNKSKFSIDDSIVTLQLPEDSSSPAKVSSENSIDYPSVFSSYRATLFFINLRKKQMQEEYEREKYYRDFIVNSSQPFLSFINSIPDRTTFKKGKRNACIQRINDEILDEIIETGFKFLSQMDDVLKYLQESCKIQERNLTELFEKLDNYDSDSETDFFYKTWTDLARTTFIRLRVMDVIKQSEIADKLKILSNTAEKLYSFSKIF